MLTFSIYAYILHMKHINLQQPEHTVDKIELERELQALEFLKSVKYPGRFVSLFSDFLTREQKRLQKKL